MNSFFVFVFMKTIKKTYFISYFSGKDFSGLYDIFYCALELAVDDGRYMKVVNSCWKCACLIL